MTATMVAVPIADTMEAKRLTEFASDVTRLADERRDTELRVLVDDLHADLIRARFDTEEEEEEGGGGLTVTQEGIRRPLRSVSRPTRDPSGRPRPSRAEPPVERDLSSGN